MKKLVVLVLSFLALSVPEALSDELLAYRDSVKQGYNFFLYVPDRYKETEESLPLVVFLHGKSLSGSDLNKVTRYGSIDALRRGVPIDALVLAPQCNTTSGWTAKTVMNTVDYVCDRYRVDQNRIYVFGISMGGWGTFKVVAAYPDRIAAAIAMCGGFTGDVEPLTSVPLWIIHGTDDDVTPFSYSTSIVKKMVATGKADRLQTTWLSGCDHSILARVFLLKQAYQWLFEHRLSTPRRPCNREYDISPSDLNQAYVGLTSPQGNLPVTLPGKKTR